MAKDQFLYMKVYTDIKERIDKGEFLPGDKLPGEEELKEQYGVSVITIKRAMQTLSKENIIRRVQGNGSFVLDKREKEEELPEEIPYKENQTGHGSEKLVGVLLEYVMESFGMELMFELDRALRKKGYKMILRFSYADRKREIEEIEFLESLGICGLIICLCHGFYYNTYLLKLVLEGFPVVILDKKMEGIQVPSIRLDSDNAVECLVKYLKDQGKRRIAMISVSEEGAITLKERRRAFRRCIEQFHLPVMEECILPESSYGILRNKPDENYVLLMMEYLKRCGQSLEGAVCMEYGLFLGFLEAVNRLGEEKFSHILPCSIDAVYLVPGGMRYAHVKQNEAAMASKAVELLEKQIYEKKVDQEEIKIPGIFLN